MPIKQEESLQFLEFLGYKADDFESVEALKTKYQEDFARKDTFKQELAKDAEFIASINGKTLGSVATTIKRIAKDNLGLEFEAGELNVQNYDELLGLVATKAKTKYETEITDLKGKITGEPDKILKEYEEKLKTSNQIAEQFKNQAIQKEQEFESFKTNIAQKERDFKKNHLFNEAFGKIEFADEANELVKEGFKSKVLSEVIFDFDDNDNFVTFDKERKPLLSKNVAGKFYDPAEYLKDKALEMGVFKINQGGGQKQTSFRTEKIVDNNQEGKTFIHPNAL